MASTTPNDTRVTARLPASVKDTLQKAADLTGATLNQFMVQAQVKEAQKVINTEQVIHLSPQDADRIFSLIENPPAPNKHLQEAIQRHQAFFSEKD
ncbi:MAG: DUF1778 domain-containing protein [Moorea sp. SIO1G6]|uniref:type II toxin-antitoxin system TacA family antitoxin n=1 Tax=Moorena sp. SIO1G6 TaxID=2607840 RepID=UPI0013BF669C|nr:DUF1778 domain-containing protein [Moorena sp. SIO1G6]NET68094.1 DUF1778 domain-containing protein [Moorena sp. SIO1G6]